MAYARSSSRDAALSASSRTSASSDQVICPIDLRIHEAVPPVLRQLGPRDRENQTQEAASIITSISEAPSSPSASRPRGGVTLSQSLTVARRSVGGGDAGKARRQREGSHASGAVDDQVRPEVIRDPDPARRKLAVRDHVVTRFLRCLTLASDARVSASPGRCGWAPHVLPRSPHRCLPSTSSRTPASSAPASSDLVVRAQQE